MTQRIRSKNPLVYAEVTVLEDGVLVEIISHTPPEGGYSTRSVEQTVSYKPFHYVRDCVFNQMQMVEA